LTARTPGPAPWQSAPSGFESEDAMNGPSHYRRAEQLLEHTASLLDTDVAPELRGELIQRQAAIASMAHAHALLAAAAIGLSAHLEVTDTNAWREVARTRLEG
jgi:hypothetical protein